VSAPANGGFLSKEEHRQVVNLDIMARHDANRSNQCWADDIFGQGGANEAFDVCQEDGPFECGIGLCPRHCKAVHVCKSQLATSSR
jgi:hypothetical protein